MPDKNSVITTKDCASSRGHSQTIDDVVEEFADQLAFLLWKTWLQGRKQQEQAKVENHLKRLPTIS